MKNNILWVRIKDISYYSLIHKLSAIGINIYSLNIVDKDILIKISYKDYLRIKKYLLTYKCIIEKHTGLKYIIDILKKRLLFIIVFIILFILLLFMNNIIFTIEVKTNNEDIRKLVLTSLDSYGIKPLSIKKKHNDIEYIINNILDNNSTTLEWLELSYDGLKAIVNVVEKTNYEEDNSNQYCHIVADKDALILSLTTYRGTILKEINDYVSKGDIIISGDISLNDEVKNKICASGKVYGEVWYKVKVTVPFKYEKKVYTGKNRYNFSLSIDDDEYKIFRSRLDKYLTKSTVLYSLDDFKINFLKEKEYKTEYVELSEDEAYDKALSLASEKVELKLSKDEEILTQKVLKKNVFNSTMYIEVFIVTKEEIGSSIIPDDTSELDNTDG